MKIVVTAATEMEIAIAKKTIAQGNISFHITGVGMMATAVSLTRLVYEAKTDLIIQAGIAGTFDAHLPLGKVVAIKDETIGDLGVMENGIWKDVFDMGFEDGNNAPFTNKLLPNEWLAKFSLLQLDEASAITVNEITTDEGHIHQLIKKYNPTIESMEGAALHYVCRQMNVPFLQLRSISNYVGERDKNKWQMKLAIENLNEVLIQLLNKMA